MQARIQGNDLSILKNGESRIVVKINGPISTDRLKPLLALHLLPINQVVFLWPHREHSS